MKVAARIERRLNEVVDFGSRVMELQDLHDHRFASGKEVAQWSSFAKTVLIDVFGSSSTYYRDFIEHLGDARTWERVGMAHAVTLSARDDFANWGCAKVQQLVEAEVFDDFLEQAEHLLANGYFQAAAVVAGCVLEDALRKLCAKHQISLPDKPKLDTMNAELAKKGAYDKLVQKRVTAETDLRNKAAHGEWDKFTKADVEAMIPFVRRFLSDHRT